MRTREAGSEDGADLCSACRAYEYPGVLRLAGISHTEVIAAKQPGLPDDAIQRVDQRIESRFDWLGYIHDFRLIHSRRSGASRREMVEVQITSSIRNGPGC